MNMDDLGFSAAICAIRVVREEANRRVLRLAKSGSAAYYYIRTLSFRDSHAAGVGGMCQASNFVVIPRPVPECCAIEGPDASISSAISERFP